MKYLNGIGDPKTTTCRIVFWEFIEYENRDFCVQSTGPLPQKQQRKLPGSRFSRHT